MKKIIVRAAIVVGLVAASFLPDASAAPGDLYVAEGSGIIYKFTPAGKRSTFASGLYQPVALAFDRAGNLFVGDSGAGIPSSQPSTICKITADGTVTTYATIASSQLLDMAFDGASNLFVSTGSEILKIAPDGTQSTFASPLEGVWALAFDRLGNLYAGVYAPGANSIKKFSLDGSSSTFIAFSGPGEFIIAMAFDADGKLFAQRGSAILKITPDGDQTTFASGDFWSALAFGDDGILFAGLNAYNASEPAIVKFAPDGIKTTFASGPLLPSAFAFEPVTEKLRNLSARGLVGTADEVLIGGFIVGGNALANNSVVARAIGPSLSDAGVSNALPDPVLELHDPSGAIIAANDNWQDTQKDQIKASGLAPTNPKESAIFATLPAGNYTAVVRGAGAATGVALVEIYSVNQ